MSTLQNIQTRVQRLSGEYIPKKLRHRFLTGVEALSTKRLASLNANGRSLTANRWTGESKLRRTVSDERFSSLNLKIILREFLPKSGRLQLSLDHSTFGCFTLAVFALSAGKGRALPVWCVITRTGKGHKLLRPLLRGFSQLIDQLSFEQRSRIVVTMDRWFDIPELLLWLDDNHLKFVVRLKSDRPLNTPWIESRKTMPTGEISLPDTPVTYHQRDWRVVRSDYRSNMKQEEPWFLLTNIPSSKLTRRQILRIYAKRFEIEEFFKDVKWIEGYEWHQIRQLKVARTVFSFIFLGWWLLIKAYGQPKDHPEAKLTHPKKRLSWFRIIWEEWLRLRQAPLFLSS
jgi:hypothetical protein